MKDLRWVVNDVSSYSPEPTEIKELINESKEVFREDLEKGKGWLIEKEPNKPFIIVGDLHGDLHSLKHILSKINERALSKGELTLVFMGDYVDRGPNQLETLLSVLKLKVLYPRNVVLLRGNHEPPKDLIPYPHNFPEELRLRFGFAVGMDLYEEFLNLFQMFPAVLHVRKEMIVLHGGLPTETFKKSDTLHEYFMGRSREQGKRVLTEILWNDPIEFNLPSTPSPRGVGYLFGKPVTQWVIKKFRVDAVFRGHEPVDNGYKMNHEGRVITLFSRLGPPYFNRRAAYAAVDPEISNWWKKIKHFIITFSNNIATS